MATNIDKALYAAPLGFEDALDAPDIEIEITDPEEVSIGVDGMEITFGEEPADIQRSFDENLAEVLPENVLLTLVSELSGDIQQDLASRGDWEKTYVEGLKLLGLQREERTEPWNGASGVVHPMITEAVVRFQSETVTETFPAQGPVRTKIRGKETIAKKEAAARVEADMNFELTENMKEFRPEHERMLWSLPSAGSAFKKVYYDPNLGRQVSMFVPAEDMILPYGCSNIHTTHRVTHRLRKTENDIRKLQLAGFYRDIELPSPGTSTTDIQKAKDKETGFRDTDNNDYFDIYESHVDLIITDFP